MKRLLGNIALFFAVTVLCLALAEVGLRVLTPFPIHGEKANKIYDIDAGYRLNPGHPNIDEHGFRNRRGDRPRVVAALGDSHTFGSNVKPEEAWPVQFENMTGVPTYNFGVGSYAVYAHFANAHRAIEQGYKYIIIELLIHNDFKVNGNSCDIDYAGSAFWQKAKERLDLHLPDCSEADNWQTARAPGFIRYFRGRAQSALLSAFDYLVAQPLADQWYRLTYSAPKKRVVTSAQSGAPGKTAEAASGSVRPASAYFAGRALKNQEIEFVFTDLDRKAVQDGIEDFEKMLTDLKQAADRKGSKVAVMFIPTKVQLFYEFLDNLDLYDERPTFRKMAENHRAIQDRLARHMDSIAMPWITAKPELIETVREHDSRGEWVYAPSAGHPNPPGYVAYAKAAMRLYERMKKD